MLSKLKHTPDLLSEFFSGKVDYKKMKRYVFKTFKHTQDSLLEFCVLAYNYQTFEQFLGGFLLVGKLIQNLFSIQNDVGPYSSLKIFVLNYNSIEDPKMKKKKNDKFLLRTGTFNT